MKYRNIKILTVTLFSIYLASINEKISVPAVRAELPQPVKLILAQVTSIAEIRDVAPTDAYFQALQSIVERYGINVVDRELKFRPEEPLSSSDRDSYMAQAVNRINAVREEAKLQPMSGTEFQQLYAQIIQQDKKFDPEFIICQNNLDRSVKRGTFIQCFNLTLNEIIQRIAIETAR